MRAFQKDSNVYNILKKLNYIFEIISMNENELPEKLLN